MTPGRENLRRRSVRLPGTVVWQRNYYEHIIRDQPDWERTHVSIDSNPVRWSQDEENPSNCL